MRHRFSYRTGLFRHAFRHSAIIVASVILTATIVVPVSRADELSDAQSKLAAAKTNAATIKTQLVALRNKASNLKDQIAALTSQIDDIDAKMNSLQAQIAEKDREITQTQQKIAKTQAQIKARNDLLRKRVRVMYEDGTVSYLDVIFSSTSFSDFLDRLNVLSLIAQQDHKLLLAAQHDRAQLQSEMQSLQAAQQSRKSTLSVMAVEKQTQQQNQATREMLLSQVDGDIATQQKNLESEQAAMDQLGGVIQSLEAARQAAATKLSEYHGSGHWTWPVPSSHVISSGYGYRTIFGGREFHGGIDIAAPIGTPIVAAASGIVLFAGPASGYGHWVVIAHPGGIMSIYGHMFSNEIYVTPGQEVQAGQQIAAVGADGEATGPHLHFAVATGITNGRMDVVDPSAYLP